MFVPSRRAKCVLGHSIGTYLKRKLFYKIRNDDHVLDNYIQAITSKLHIGTILKNYKFYHFHTQNRLIVYELKISIHILHNKYCHFKMSTLGFFFYRL